MNIEAVKRFIESGKAVLGIELGSTRIKAVLIDDTHAPIASGDHTWENRLEGGVWTYHLADVWAGIQDAYANMVADVKQKYGVELTKLAAFGVSAMMHGYLPFDKDGQQLAEFRTWRNTMTGPAAAELTELLGFNIPQRWSIAHLYQAMLNGEAHVADIDHLTTLAGYVHWQLSGRKVLGVGEASGMFPIDSDKCDYDQRMIDLVDAKAAEKGYAWTLCGILPAVLNAGEDAGVMTAEGAKLLDPTGKLEAGALMAPPEGDAGTGMVAGKPVAMVHCNNCTSDINAWAGMLKGFADACGLNISMNDVYVNLFNAALEGEKDCGGVVNVPLFSGEPVVGLDEGRPMMVRMPDAKLTFANFARSLVAGAMTSLKIGMDILAEENVQIDSLLGHGGYFKTPGVGQKILSAALNTPISVMETAGEGGPWGMAVLAAFRANGQGEALETYLNGKVFAGAAGSTIAPDADDVAGLDAYTARFQQALSAEASAVAEMK